MRILFAKEMLHLNQPVYTGDLLEWTDFFGGGIAGDNAATGSTLPETNMAPENRPSQKETRFSNHPFSGAMLASGSVPFFFLTVGHTYSFWHFVFLSVSYEHFK